MTTIRPGGAEDVDAVLAMGDDAVARLVAAGRTGQWGTEPWTAVPARRTTVERIAAAGELWIAELDGVPAAAMGLSEQCTPYAPQAAEPELYVTLLLAARAVAGRGAGRALLDHAREQTRARGRHLLRVDCYAGGDGALVAYYTGCGFTPSATFTVRDWPGQVLEQRVQP